MNDRSAGIFLLGPYEIAAVRLLRQTSLQERETVLRGVGYNSELPPQEMIYIDLCTDSGVSAYAHCSEIKGLKQVEEPARSKYEPSRFTQL